MKLARLTFALAIATAATAATVATACAPERMVAPRSAASSFTSIVAAPQVPLLFVVDGVRLQRDQVPTLTADQVAAVQVIKGHAALKQYGPDASYGVVVITTKAAAAPRS